MTQINISPNQQSRLNQIQERLDNLAAQAHLIQGQIEAYKIASENMLVTITECAGADPKDRYRLSDDRTCLVKAEEPNGNARGA